jgi:hypothetical protein
VKVHQLAELRFGVCWLKFAAPAPAPAVARGQNELLKKKGRLMVCCHRKGSEKIFQGIIMCVRACGLVVRACVGEGGGVCAREAQQQTKQGAAASAKNNGRKL